MKEKRNYDLLILGGGPAGMTAAIYAARANLKTAIIEIDICGGLVNSTYVVENFPTYKSIHGMELMQKLSEQILDLGVYVEEVSEILDINLANPKKSIETEEFIYNADAMILATGRNPMPLDLQTDCQQIHYCSICDGSAYKDKSVLVVGGGNSGFDESLYLLSLGVKEIILIEKMDHFFASQSIQETLSGYENVTLKLSTEVSEIIGKEKLETVMLKDLNTKETYKKKIDGIFVYMGQVPNTKMFADSVLLDKNGYVLSNEEMITNLDGVFVAGDVRQKSYRQITTAMNDGTIAALNAEKYIRINR